MFAEAPIKIKSSLEDKKAVENDEKAFFEIEMSKKIRSKDDITWTFNGRKIDIETDKRYEIERDDNTCRLIIKNIVLEDEGAYTVELNGSRSSANLTVEGSNTTF